jgi:hypothetical protein
MKLSEQIKMYRNFKGGNCEHLIGGFIKTIKIICRIEGSNKIKDRSYNITYSHYNKYLENLNCRYNNSIASI